MKDIKVSVIVPVYNTKEYLKKCINSLLRQTLDGMEIVIVDDGSTDGSTKILQEYEKNYPDTIQLIIKENGGQASARNLALGLCRGKYIGFLDSDDFVKKEMFETLYKKAEKNNLDYVGCGYTEITYVDGKKIILNEYMGQKPCDSNREMFRESFASPFINFYKKTILDESKVLFPEGLIYEDTAFFVNLIPYIHRIGCVKKPLAIRVRRSNSTTTLTDPEKISEIFQIIKIILEFYTENGWIKDYKNELEYFCMRVLLCSSMERVGKVKHWKQRCMLVRKTMNFIKENFKDYRKNPYFRRTKKDLYIKYINVYGLMVICEIIHLKQKSGKLI